MGFIFGLREMTENILESFSLRFDRGSPDDYTWIDLGNFDNLSQEEEDRLADKFPCLFTNRPDELFLPFENIGFVRRAGGTGKSLSITVERIGDELLGVLRGQAGDIAEIWHVHTGEVRVRLTNNFHVENYLKTMTGEEQEERIKTYGSIEQYLGIVWKCMINTQYLEYMRVSVDMRETVTAYTALPSASNAKRLRRNKKPIYTWTVIDVTAQPEKEEIVATGNGHASPRRHRRRGHFRQYLNGRRTWVNEMMVGKIEFGYAQHSYTAHSKKELVNG